MRVPWYPMVCFLMFKRCENKCNLDFILVLWQWISELVTLNVEKRRGGNMLPCSWIAGPRHNNFNDVIAYFSKMLVACFGYEIILQHNIKITMFAVLMFTAAGKSTISSVVIETLCIKATRCVRTSYSHIHS